MPGILARTPVTGVVYTSVIILKRIPTSWIFLCLYLEADIVEVFIVNNPFIDTNPFFYKNKLYKNTQAEICPKIMNKLRTITRLKF